MAFCWTRKKKAANNKTGSHDLNHEVFWKRARKKNIIFANCMVHTNAQQDLNLKEKRIQQNENEMKKNKIECIVSQSVLHSLHCAICDYFNYYVTINYEMKHWFGKPFDQGIEILQTNCKHASIYEFVFLLSQPPNKKERKKTLSPPKMTKGSRHRHRP